MKMNDPRNLVLVGSSGAGKTVEAEALATISERSVFDVDAEIVKSVGKDIPAIFADKDLGEDFFRDLETKFLGRAAREGHRIIVPGAGAVCKEPNRILIRLGGFGLWIDPSLRILQKRLRGNKDRPNAQNPADIERRFWERRPLYADVADVRVSFDVELPIEEVTERILHKLGWK